MNHSVKPTEKVWHGPEDGLPPVGEMVQSTRYANPCRVKYASKQVIVVESDFGDECVVSLESLSCVKTEEDKAVEEMEKILEREGCGGYDPIMLRILFANGYRKQEVE